MTVGKAKVGVAVTVGVKVMVGVKVIVGVKVMIGVKVKSGVDVNAGLSVAVSEMGVAVGACDGKLHARMASRQTRKPRFCFLI